MATNVPPSERPVAPAPSAAPSIGLADPGPWAVSAFATTSFMLGMYNAHLVGSGSLPIMLPLAFFFGGLIQIIVGILEYGRGNIFGMVVFGTYGPFWVIFGAIEIWFAKMATATSVNAGVALFLAMFAVLTFYFFLASLKTDAVLVVVFALIFIGLVFLAIGAQSGVTFWTEAGGWVTLAFAVLAWYHAAADIINFTFGRALVPVGKIKK